MTIDGTNGCVFVEGAPLLPRYAETFELPENAREVKVEITPSSTEYLVISEGIVVPSPLMVPLTPPGSPFEFELPDQMSPE